MTARRFRQLALALEGAVEGAHMGHADFRLQNRIFASLDTDEKNGTVALAPEQQQDLLAAHPAMFEPAAGKWGLSGYTRVRLTAANDDAVGEALTLAWQNALRKGPAKPTTSKPRTTATAGTAKARTRARGRRA